MSQEGKQTLTYEATTFPSVGVTRCAYNARGEKPVVVFLDVFLLAKEGARYRQMYEGQRL
jgi:hypothetical protein